MPHPKTASLALGNPEGLLDRIYYRGDVFADNQPTVSKHRGFYGNLTKYTTDS